MDNQIEKCNKLLYSDVSAASDFHATFIYKIERQLGLYWEPHVQNLFLGCVACQRSATLRDEVAAGVPVPVRVGGLAFWVAQLLLLYSLQTRTYRVRGY